MKKCKNCGAEIAEGLMYCGSCGAAQESSRQNDNLYGGSQQSSFQGDQWNNGQQYDQNNQWNNGQQQYNQNNQWNNGQQYGQNNQWNNNQQYGQNNQWNNGQQYGQNNQWNNGQQYGQNNQWNNNQQYNQNQWNQQTGAYSTYHPMKWYKFIIYFQLFAAMALNLLSAIGAFTGAQYGEDAEALYYMFENLKTVDILMGVVCILLAVGDLVARQKLSGFKRDAVRWYLGMMAASVVVSIVYIVAVCSVTGLSIVEMMAQANLRASIWGSVVMLAVNYTYFQKRRDMFCN